MINLEFRFFVERLNEKELKSRFYVVRPQLNISQTQIKLCFYVVRRQSDMDRVLHRVFTSWDHKAILIELIISCFNGVRPQAILIELKLCFYITQQYWSSSAHVLRRGPQSAIEPNRVFSSRDRKVIAIELKTCFYVVRPQSNVDRAKIVFLRRETAK